VVAEAVRRGQILEIPLIRKQVLVVMVEGVLGGGTAPGHLL
jgi:hypothetical protein